MENNGENRRRSRVLNVASLRIPERKAQSAGIRPNFVALDKNLMRSSGGGEILFSPKSLTQRPNAVSLRTQL